MRILKATTAMTNKIRFILMDLAFNALDHTVIGINFVFTRLNFALVPICLLFEQRLNIMVFLTIFANFSFTQKFYKHVIKKSFGNVIQGKETFQI